MKRYVRTALALAIVATTVAAFSYYAATHPETLKQIRQLHPLALAALLVLYGAVFLAWVLVTRASLWLFGKTMPPKENLLFNAYSSLINFFGPGQSGPAFRGLYLKKRHNLDIKKYIFATVLYYGFYAVLSALLMVVGSRPWWQTLLTVAAVASVSVLLIRRYRQRANIGNTPLSLKTIAAIFGATLVQVGILVAIYAIELHNVGAQASASQIMAYTGVANFSLFVALTPGAIGIREAFLVFSQQLHHIDNSTIVAANIIDRAVYFVFLGILAVAVVGLHAKDKLLQTSKN